MSRTTTRFVHFRHFQLGGPSAAIVIKLMMACNDMQIANECLAEWKRQQPRHRKHRERGARMYFVRLQISHLFEAFKIVEQIRGDSNLMRRVKQCDLRTQNSFRELESFLASGAKARWLEDMVGKLRHNLVFHYTQNDKLIIRAVGDLANDTVSRHSSITRGSTAYLWYFKLADDVLDRIVVRQIWGVPSDEELCAEVDRIADEIHEAFLCFVDFAGEFIWNYCGGS